jgi:anti-anti-sigma factor
VELTAEQLPDGIDRIVLAGRMDSTGTDRITQRLAALTSSRPALIVVDLSQVSFLASVGIRTLVSSAKALAARGGRMALAGPRPLVRDVLAIAGIDALIPIHNDVTSACAGLKAPAGSL